METLLVLMIIFGSFTAIAVVVTLGILIDVGKLPVTKDQRRIAKAKADSEIMKLNVESAESRLQLTMTNHNIETAENTRLKLALERERMQLHSGLDP